MFSQEFIPSDDALLIETLDSPAYRGVSESEAEEKGVSGHLGRSHPSLAGPGWLWIG